MPTTGDNTDMYSHIIDNILTSNGNIIKRYFIHDQLMSYRLKCSSFLVFLYNKLNYTIDDLICILIYLKRLQSIPDYLYLTESNKRYILICIIILYQKFYGDKFFSDKYFSDITKLNFNLIRDTQMHIISHMPLLINYLEFNELKCSLIV